jgi:hypothetical protein
MGGKHVFYLISGLWMGGKHVRYPITGLRMGGEHVFYPIAGLRMGGEHVFYPITGLWQRIIPKIIRNTVFHTEIKYVTQYKLCNTV